MSQQLRRCAIYTRKSFDPPAGQELTSLDSQRRICASYLASQQHRGWLELIQPYDDSGRSGANTARPALQKLLADVEAGLIDVVIVYKLDRLTRTLFDFVRLTDFLDRHQVALVSITQNFDTSDSLGRLVLNILLTFAQFEREITSDRMKDRIRVWREMGRWGGGCAPLGYDNIAGKLVVNRAEARSVRMAFENFARTKSTNAVFQHLREQGCRRKAWVSKTGNAYGGGPILLSSLHHILRNPVYIGKIRHHDQVHEGIHEPIVEHALFDRVQKYLLEQSVCRPRRIENLLTGLLFDAAGRPMCVKAHPHKGTLHRYYISNVSAWAKRRKLKRMRADGDGLERLVLSALQNFLANREALRDVLLGHGLHGHELDRLTKIGSAHARLLRSVSVQRQRDLLCGLLERVELSPDRVTIVVLMEELRRFLEWDGVGIFGVDTDARKRNGRTHFLHAEASVVRATNLYALPVSPKVGDSKPNAGMLRLLNEAEIARALMTTRRELGIEGLAQAHNCTMARFSRLIRLSYLAPDISLAIRDGTQPAHLNRTLLYRANLPLDWALQRTMLGFPDQPEHFRNQKAAGRV